MPYRTAPLQLVPRTAAPGLVSDMVDQFADAYAYLRELVQNGIDAGAKSIRVSVERQANGSVHTRVEDDGSGMSRATLEGPLLTLFSSSKEGDARAIGKYGIGFVSVLASKPVHVEVHSWRGGESWLLRLFGDHSYELEPGADRSGSGTSVSLLHGMDREAFTLHHGRVREALVRWCRHARIPIALRCFDHEAPTEALELDLHEELGLDGIETVTWADGETRIVVSVRPSTEPSSLGYYNRGLTLFESERTEPALDGLCVKIDSPDLAHTLSRDDVRRDRTQRKLVDRARRLGETKLRGRLLDRLLHAAATADLAATAELLDALARPFFGSIREATIPLVEPLDDRTTLTLAELASRSPYGILLADGPSAKTRVLARLHVPVVRGIALAPLLRRTLGTPHVLTPIPETLGVAEPDSVRGGDAPLLAALRRLLRAVGHPARRVVLARFSNPGRRGRLAGTPKDFAVLPGPFEPDPEGEHTTLFLDTLDPDVANARRLATRSPEVAAHLLCRLLLLDMGPLPAPAIDALLDAARLEAEAP